MNNDTAAPSDDFSSRTEASSSEVERLRKQISDVYHDLNNSLSVISGNAQLLSEMAQAEDLGVAFTEPLNDIEAARTEISEALTQLDRIRQEEQQAEETQPGGEQGGEARTDAIKRDE